MRPWSLRATLVRPRAHKGRRYNRYTKPENALDPLVGKPSTPYAFPFRRAHQPGRVHEAGNAPQLQTRKKLRNLEPQGVADSGQRPDRRRVLPEFHLR